MNMAEYTPPLVSIGIPTYNRANSYLRHSLRSACRQTYPNIEIIVSDNCSPDSTESVVKGADDSRIRYYRQSENIGPLKNRAFCLEQARGEYFVMLLDDDVIDDDFISCCMDAVKGHGEPGLVLTGVRQIDAEGNVLSSAHNRMQGCSTEEFILGWFDNKVPLYLCSTLFNTKGLREIGGLRSKTNLYDDVVAYMRLAAKYGRVDVFDVKASFRRHDSNIGGGAHFSAWCEDSLYLMDVICEVVPEHAARLRERGMVYFSQRNYNRLAGISSLKQRVDAYRMVYRMFDHSYSPLKFLYAKKFARIFNMMKKPIRSFL